MATKVPLFNSEVSYLKGSKAHFKHSQLSLNTLDNIY